MVFESGTVSIRVVGAGSADPFVVFFVVDKRDGCGIGAERGAGQGEASSGVVESLPQSVSPRERVTGVMNLVKNNQSFVVLSVTGVQLRLIRHLGVGKCHPLILAAHMNVGIFKIRVDRYAYLSGGIRPLLFQVVGGRYHGELTHHTAAKKFTSQSEGKSGFTGTRGCHRHKVTRVGFKIFFHSLRLPST